jgi:hypothetical protein
MEIGKPQKTIEVSPARERFPQRTPAPAPAPTPTPTPEREPVKAPEKV